MVVVGGCCGWWIVFIGSCGCGGVAVMVAGL